MPVAMETYSSIPPIKAPNMFAANAPLASRLRLKEVAKTIPAKKMGSEVATAPATARQGKDHALRQARPVTYGMIPTNFSPRKIGSVASADQRKMD